MKRYAVITTKSYVRTNPVNGPETVSESHVDNVVLWDGITEWSPGEGFELAQLPDDSPVSIGWVAVEIDGVWEFSEN